MMAEIAMNTRKRINRINERIEERRRKEKEIVRTTLSLISESRKCCRTRRRFIWIPHSTEGEV